jgi:hypothetical protein
MPSLKQNAAQPNPETLLLQEVQAQDFARRMGQYTVLGKMYSLETPKGVITFPKHGAPAIAQETVNGEPGERLLLLGNWPALPDQKTYSEEFCKACLTSCSACGGKGKAGCIFVGCGGTGRVKTGETACPDCVAKVGHFEPACKTCGGHGAVAVVGPCPACQGSKVANCGPCRGTGKRPTGFKAGAAEGAPCISCRGSLRAGGWKKQDLWYFLMGKLGDYLAIGPILSIAATPVDVVSRFEPSSGSRFAGDGAATAAASRQMLRLAVPPDQFGTPLMVLLPMINSKLTIPGPAYFFGGAKFA